MVDFDCKMDEILLEPFFSEINYKLKYDGSFHFTLMWKNDVLIYVI